MDETNNELVLRRNHNQEKSEVRKVLEKGFIELNRLENQYIKELKEILPHLLDKNSKVTVDKKYTWNIKK